MNTKAAISVLNQMREDGVIERYAIGGAVAAVLHGEPIDTEDIDVFIVVRGNPLILDLSPVIEYLNGKGCMMQGEYVVVAGCLVQLLAAERDSLEDEALSEALQKDLDGVTVSVFSIEHLAAIALKTGRAKDKLRLVQFLEFGVLDDSKFSDILRRYDLLNSWEEFRKTIVD